MNAKCPHEEELVRLFEEGLPETERLALERHTRACSECQAALDALHKLDAALAEPEPAAPDFMERLLALPETAPPQRPAAGRLLVLAAAAAAVVLLALVLRDFRGARGERALPPVQTTGLRSSPTQTTERAPTGRAPTGRAPTVRVPTESVPAEVSVPSLSIPALHRLARGADLEHARLALARLGRMRRRESLPVLIAAVRRVDRRSEAVQALGALGDARAVRALEPLLLDSLVGAQAREALIRVGGGAAAAALSRAIEESEDENQAALLIDALAQADGAVGVRQLGRLLGSEHVARVEAARKAIHIHAERLLPDVLAQAASASGSEVDPVLLVLELLTPAQAVPALKRLLRKRAHRERAARLLMRIDTVEAADALWDVRHLAEARRSFRHAGPVTERYLLDRLSEDSRSVQRSAIDLLGLCGGPLAVAPLAALVPDPALASSVLLSLGRIGGEAAVEVLAALSERPALQRRAMAALGMTGCSAAVAELERLGANTRSLRGDAQRALATLPYAEAVEAILRLGGGGRSHRSAERALRGMERELVLTTLDTLLERDPPLEKSLAASARRVRRAVGGPVHADASRIALN